MVEVKTYVASYYYEEGTWIGRVEFSAKSGANTQGRTLERCMANMREAVAAALDCGEDAFELEHVPHLNSDLFDALNKLEMARVNEERAKNAALVQYIQTVQTFLNAGFSNRDTGTVMGVVRSRVDQIAKDKVSIAEAAEALGRTVAHARKLAKTEQVLLPDDTVPKQWLRMRLDEVGSPGALKVEREKPGSL
jgi:predicted RNase H-like HicB family nuclease